MNVKNPAGAIHTLQPNITEDQIKELKVKGFIFLDEKKEEVKPTVVEKEVVSVPDVEDEVKVLWKDSKAKSLD